MAKGNLILGTAGNSVGDVVLYRRDGAQVSRVRVRKVANPRTNAQSIQRSFFAPVAKFFSPLATVLERSWEGLNKSKSYSKFLAENVKLARQNGWLLPKGTGFFPLPYQLSNGTLPTVLYAMEDVNFQINLPLPAAGVEATTIGQLSAAFVAAGYKAGDIVSFVLVSTDVDASSYIPASFQFAIDVESTATLASIVPATYTCYGNNEDGWRITHDVDLISAAAVIVARYEGDKWRRSKQFLALSSSLMTSISTADYKAAAIASYGNSASGDNPLVYLDGDELQG